MGGLGLVVVDDHLCIEEVLKLVAGHALACILDSNLDIVVVLNG